MKDPERQQALKQQAEAQLKQENGIVTVEAIADRAYKIAYDGAIKGQGADIGGNRRQAPRWLRRFRVWRVAILRPR
ncbi:hypothetical protein V2H77_16815 [Photorhabdus sp. P32]|uniref:hypothetical protein n=1 Tax=Photorhabdus sp. P32 TaxID=3117549 RepID=UPI00311AF9A0